MSSINNLHLSTPLQPRDELLLTDQQLRTDLIEAMRAVQILDQPRIQRFLHLRPALLPSPRRQQRRRDRVLVHPVQEPLDDPKRNQPPHIHPHQGFRMLDAPALQTLPLLQGAIQLHQPNPRDVALPLPSAARGAGPGRGQAAVGKGDVAGAFVLHVGILDESGQLGRGGVDGGEGEDVEQDDAAVVEEVGDGLAHEAVVGVGAQGDLAHAVEAVDVRQDQQHGEVPVGVRQRVEPHGAEGHVVRPDGRRCRVGGEELDVQGVGFVDGDHAFAVVVQVLEQDLAQGVDFARVRGGEVAGQELGLFFQGAEEGGQFEDDGEVGGRVGGFVQYEAEVEDVFVAVVFGRGETHGVAEDAVVGDGQGDGAVAELLARDDVGGDAGEVEEGGLGRRGGGGGDYGVGRDLVDDFGPWTGALESWRRGVFGRVMWFSYLR